MSDRYREIYIYIERERAREKEMEREKQSKGLLLVVLSAECPMSRMPCIPSMSQTSVSGNKEWRP